MKSDISCVCRDYWSAGDPDDAVVSVVFAILFSLPCHMRAIFDR